MSVTDRERIAYHEAGHAVIAWTFGLEVASASIVPGEDWLGRITVVVEGLTGDPYHDTPQYEVFRAHALTLLAGEVAAEMVSGVPIVWGEFVYGGGSDFDKYVDDAERLGWYDTTEDGSMVFHPMEDKMAEVRRLLEERWEAVEAVAKALLASGQISGTDTIKIMSEIGPAPIATVYADYQEELRYVEARRRLGRASEGNG